MDFIKNLSIFHLYLQVMLHPEPFRADGTGKGSGRVLGSRQRASSSPAIRHIVSTLLLGISSVETIWVYQPSPTPLCTSTYYYYY